MSPFRSHSGHPDMVLAALLAVISSFAILLWWAKQNHILTIQDNTMAPALYEGDAIEVTPVPVAELRKGDVVSYINEANGNVVTQRIQSIDTKKGTVTTKGDAFSDTGEPFAASSVIGRVDKRISGFGLLLDLMRNPVGLAIVFYIPAAGIVLTEYRRLAWHYHRPTYQLHRQAA